MAVTTPSGLLIDTSLTPGSIDWWVSYLDGQLEKRRPNVEKFARYYEGDHDFGFATSKFVNAFGELFKTLADNWMPLVVEAPVERLKVQGYRFGKDQDADDRAWEIWQRNGLDADSNLAHREAIKCGEAYLLVQPGPDGPEITVEGPLQAIVAFESGSTRRRAAAFKKWVDASGDVFATLYMPDAIYRFRKPASVATLGSGPFALWAPRGTRSDVEENPLGVVPMIPLRNSPSLGGGGQSDIEKVIPLQDAVNKLVADMLVASEYAAFPQRWASGLDIPKDPSTGQPVKAIEWAAAVSRMWTSPSKETTFGSFAVADLSNYVGAIEMSIQHIAAQTRTPPHYLLGTIVNASGDALKAAETGLVARVRDKMVDFGESHEEAIRLAFRLEGDETRGNAIDAETIWADPEYRSEAEITDAMVKQRGSLGIPLELAWERLGYSPKQIKRMKELAGLPDRPPPGATTAGADTPPDPTLQ